MVLLDACMSRVQQQITSNIADCELDSAGTVLARLDLNGACIWSKVLSGYGSTGLGLLVDPMGDLFVTGSTPYSGPSSIEGQPITRGTFIGKYSWTGNQIWVKELVAEFSTSSIARYFPYQLKYFNGSILVHGAAFQYANSGPWQVDTVVADVVEGGGHVLMSLDASNGVARWIGEGRWVSVTVPRTRCCGQLMDVDAIGKIHCAGDCRRRFSTVRDRYRADSSHRREHRVSVHLSTRRREVS